MLFLFAKKKNGDPAQLFVKDSEVRAARKGGRSVLTKLQILLETVLFGSKFCSVAGQLWELAKQPRERNDF